MRPVAVAVLGAALLIPAVLPGQGPRPMPAALTWTVASSAPSGPGARTPSRAMQYATDTTSATRVRTPAPGRALRVLRATAVGAVAGAALGAWAGYALDDHMGYLTGGGARRRRYVRTGGMAGAVAGAYLGAVVGFALEPREP